jgi:hypothetical protein
MTVIVASEKHGTVLYATASALLSRRIRDDYWYDADETARAKHALGRGEREAWIFLDSRSDYEYEYVEKQEVIA